MKKILGILTVLVSFFICMNITNAYYDKVDSSEKVYDFANKLTDDEKDKLKDKINTFIEKHDMDLALVVLNNYGGSLDSYADDFYDYNGFGLNSSRDGLVIVLNYDSYGIDAYISTSGQAILVYDDSRIDSILSSMSSSKTYGTYRIFESAITRADGYANSGVASSNQYCHISSTGEYYCDKPPRHYPLIQFLLISLAIAGIETLVLASKNKMIRKAVTAENYLDQSSVNIYERKDIFVTTHTSSYTINTSSGGGGGSHGGGSSTHHSSSGRTHGGGGRRL